MNQRNGNGESTAIVEFQHRQEAIGTVDVASARQIAEVQGAMIVAKKFPRNHLDAHARIMTACKRRSLAEQAIYSYPKGGSRVEGPSIRLAEALAQNWGNMEFGITELEQRHGESTVMAFCIDLETNTRQTKVFTVKHARKAKGEIKQLDDPREIYEMTANQGARRMRACILSIIPGDVVEAAVNECNKTLRAGSNIPIQDRAKMMIASFAELGVTRAQLEQRLGHKLESISEHELNAMHKIDMTIRDNMAPASQFFRPMPPDGSGPELTPDDIKPSGGEKPSPETAERDELKAEAIKLGLVDKSCSWRVERLREAVVREHDRLEAEKAKGIHADEPPPDYPDNTEPMDVG
jgi:hypothetical protein